MLACIWEWVPYFEWLNEYAPVPCRSHIEGQPPRPLPPENFQLPRWDPFAEGPKGIERAEFSIQDSPVPYLAPGGTLNLSV
jgi:hypothetical protein